jgi:7-carboxy-7-deazaguanine synthase
MKVNEIFYSIQGEGKLVGIPSIFLRLTGCNLRCSFCDTKYAYLQGKEMSIPAILDKIRKFTCNNICITGGEPLLQKDTIKLIEALLQKNYEICLETNGSISIKKLVEKKSLVISLDIKCPSSGSHEQMNIKNISYLSEKDQLKFIINNKKDYNYAKEIFKRHNPSCTVFFQSVWGTNPKKLASWILNDRLPVRLALQLHKIIWGEKRGI